MEATATRLLKIPALFLLVYVTKCHAANVVCGTMMPYNVSTDPTMPAKNGFAAGTFLEGYTVYVGQAASTCNLQPFMPARISTVRTGRGAGAYMACGGSSYSNRDTFYLLSHPRLKWVATNTTFANSVPGRLVVAGPVFGYYIGRLNITLKNGTVYTEVSKVHFDAGAYGMWFPFNGGEDYTLSGFEILTCDGDVGRVNVTYAGGIRKMNSLLPQGRQEMSRNMARATNESAQLFNGCAFWTLFSHDKAPTINGFSAGIGLNFMPSYVGRGLYTFEHQPGRLQVAEPSGLYIAWENGEKLVLDQVEYLALVEGCTCSWMRPETAVKRRGVVLVLSIMYTFMVGRKVWPNGMVSISKVDSWSFTQWYIDARGVPVIDQATEVLVCETRNSVNSAPPTLKYGNEACAGWMTFDTNSSAPATNGYSMGTDVSNLPFYVGRGRFVPGRVQIEKPVGFFPNIEGIVKLTSRIEYLVLPKGCTCKWVPLPEALDFKGVVSVLTYTDTILISRLPLENGKVGLVSVYQSMLFGWFKGTDNKMIEVDPNDALVCENKLVTSGRSIISARACALWMEYNNNNVPMTNGFSAGTSLHNTTAWIGRAFYGGQNQPGRIQIEPPTGVYVSLGKEIRCTTKTEFLALPEGCSCNFYPPAAAMKRPGLVHAVDENYRHLIGRWTAKDGRVAISKVVFPTLEQWFVGNASEGTWETKNMATEILVCETKDMSDDRPTLKFADEACDTWATYKMDKAPATNGFAVGTSWKNTTVYVGRGWFNGQFAPGRIQIEKRKGLFVESEYKEHFVFKDIEYLVVAKGCTCSWVPVSEALTHNGIVVVPDESESFYVSRKLLKTGQVAIAKIESSSMVAWYTNEVGETVEGTADEVLVCESRGNARVADEEIPFRACGLWMEYSSARAPQTNGFSAGDGLAKKTKVYVGRGFYAKQFAPGRIQTTRPSGLNIPWGDGEKRVTKKAEYLVVPNDCTCSWMNPNAALKRPGLMRSPDPNFRHLVGRHTFPEGQVTVTKVNGLTLSETYINAKNEAITGAATELLVCETSDRSGVRPTVAYSSFKGCGVWAAYNNDDAPSKQGLAVGKSWRNTTAYVGRGWFREQFAPGRVQVESPKGVYFESALVERYAVTQTEFLVVPESCECQWIYVEDALERSGLVTVPNADVEFLVGRVELTDDIVAISKVDPDMLIMWYIDEDGEAVEDDAGEVLVCQKTN